jgi:two-component system sensor histidine kinase/response regulator
MLLKVGVGVTENAEIAPAFTAGHERSPASEQPVPSEPQHRLLFEHNPLPMMVYERATLRVIAVSNAAVAGYGYSREEFLTLTLRDLTPTEDLELMDQFFEANLRGERPGLVSGARRHRCKDGTIIDVDITGDDLEFDGRGCRIVLCQDVTERNRAMAELVQAREQLSKRAEEHRLLFERNPQPMLAYDCETLRIVAVSDASIANTGYAREEFLTMTLLDIAPEEDHAAMLEYARANLGKRVGLLHARPRRHRRKDGTIIDVEVTSDDLVLRGRECRVCLCQDVTERNRASAELALARDEAVEASNMKSAFLANMSHEIRTPMNGVIGMTELLLDMDLTDGQRECAEQIARSGEQMLAIINDILDISKIETGHLELDINDFDLHETIDGTCSFAGAQARAKGLRLEVQIGSDVPRRVRGDGRRLHQVVLNLVSNAIKFTSTGGVSVRVSVLPTAGEDGAMVRVAVADSGIGIDPSNLQRMFEPFTQADVSTTRLYGGTGLGLAIARELVELMGGTITADSELGVGSTFSFELVLAPAHAGDEALPARAAGVLAAAPADWASAPLVLVAEDSQVNQIVAARTLERCGCRVDVVGDGRAALEALAKQHYDAVLMDCEMPDMDGYQATAELRRRERDADGHTPVIAMTAQAMDGDRERCIDAGMDDFISKPMRHQDLADTLRRWIPSHSVNRSEPSAALASAASSALRQRSA